MPAAGEFAPSDLEAGLSHSVPSVISRMPAGDSEYRCMEWHGPHRAACTRGAVAYSAGAPERAAYPCEMLHQSPGSYTESGQAPILRCSRVPIGRSWLGVPPAYWHGVSRAATMRPVSAEHTSPDPHRLSLTLQAANIGIWEWDQERGTLYLSPHCKRWLGYPDDEVRSRLDEWEDRLHPDDRAAAVLALQAFLKRGERRREFEFRLRQRDGSYRWMLARASVDSAPGDAALRVSGCLLDITGRRQAEEERIRVLMREKAALAQASATTQLLRDVLERVSDALVALDTDWRFTYVNPQAASLFGRRPEDLIGKHIWTEFPEGVGQPFHRAYEKAMAEQVPIRMENYYEPWDRWFENRIFPSRDGLSIFFHEITGRKKAEFAAQESTELLKAQNRALEQIAKGAPLQQTLDLLLRSIEAQSPGMLCSILLLDPDGVHVRHVAAPALPEGYTRAIDGQPIGPRAGSCGTAAFLAEPVIVEDIASDPLWNDYRDLALGYGLRACWSIPIFDAQRRVLGTFALYFRNPGRPTERHWRLIEIATQTAAIAIVHHRETEALRKSEKRLRLAVNGGNIGIWEWDIGARHLVWNDRMKEMFGWQAERQDLTLRMWAEAVVPEDRHRTYAALRRALASGADLDVEYRIRIPDGSIRWISARGRCEYGAAGRPVRMMGVVLDITDRKRTEEEINRREVRLAEAQRIAHLGSFEWDIKRNVVHRSEELCRILGLSHRSVFQADPVAHLERVHPEDHSNVKSTIEQAMQQRKPFDLEYRIVRTDGAVRHLRGQGRWVLDEAGEPVKLMGICHDITERKQAVEQLRRSEERFQFAARATNDAIYDLDPATGSIWWNQGVTSIFQYSAQEAGDLAWWSEHVHPEDRERVVASLHEVKQSGGQYWSQEYRFRRAGGDYADILDRGFVLYDAAGKPLRMIGAMADVSDRKRAVENLERSVAARTAELREKNRELENEVAHRERVEESLRAKNEELKGFAYTVSHDLKAPLRGIAGYARELDRRHREGLGDRAVFCIQQILTASGNLDRLIEDLLHYSRLDAETPTETEVDVRQLVSAILADRRQAILEHKAEVSVEVASANVRTWERGLAQVLTNFIDNALKYSRDANPPRIHIAGEELPGSYRIAVSDNGIGFDMKYHDRIFGLFNRLVRQEEFEGTGAGLAIAKKVTDKLGGKILAESQPGAGAKFIVEFPTGRAATAGR